MSTALDIVACPDTADLGDDTTNAPDLVPDSTKAPESAVVPVNSSPAQPEALMLPPEDLVIDDNVRKSFDLGDHPKVTASMRQHGVVSPVLAHRELDGTITVIEGQIRVLTALAFGIARVPVWVTPAPAVAPAERAIRRIATQINANDYRIPFTEGDRAAGMTQMFEFGASLTRISAEVGRKRDQVKLAVAVGASATARHSVDAGQLDFEQAAVLADYEKVGDTDAVARLLAAPRATFAYEARRIAGDRAEARQRFLESLSFAAHGFGVLTSEPDNANDRFINYELLRTADGNDITTDDLHATAADWVVYLYPTDEQILLDRDTGAVVDPDTVDPNTQDRPDTVAAEGLRHADTVHRQARWEPTCYLRADRLTASRFRLASDFEHDAEVIDSPEVSHDLEPQAATERENNRAQDSRTAVVVPEESPQEIERREEAAQVATRQREEAARVAAERQERERQAARRVRELNKQGQAALEARREYVTGFLTRKTPPPLAAVFVAESLADDPGLLNEFNADRTAHELLGVTGWRSELLTSISTAKPTRCQVITLGLVLGAYEKRTGKDAWRYTDRGVRRYLHFLADNGHHLTPVEQAAAGDLDPNTIDIDS